PLVWRGYMNLRRIFPSTLMLLVAFFVGVRLTMASPQESVIRIRTTVNESWDDRGAGVSDDLTYRGRPLSYWLNIIRDRDETMISLAFGAIRSLGPRAAVAVPELTRTVSAPFTPIHIGKDSDEMIADKLYDIEVRSAAIDALASIGEAGDDTADPVGINCARDARLYGYRRRRTIHRLANT